MIDFADKWTSILVAMIFAAILGANLFGDPNGDSYRACLSFFATPHEKLECAKAIFVN